MIKYLLAAITLVLIDGIYLNIIKGYFNRQIKLIQGSDMKVNFIAAALTYVFLIFAINYFIIRNNKSPKDAALLGLCIYAVFELTNYALFSKLHLLTVIIDTAWGTMLFGLTAMIVYKLMKFI
jgi:uncharacterized membrane protein